jgi:transposase InsO family protein
VGWSIDSVQNSNLVVNALDMAIKNRNPAPGGVVHSDHGRNLLLGHLANESNKLAYYHPLAPSAMPLTRIILVQDANRVA